MSHTAKSGSCLWGCQQTQICCSPFQPRMSYGLLVLPKAIPLSSWLHLLNPLQVPVYRLCHCAKHDHLSPFSAPTPRKVNGIKEKAFLGRFLSGEQQTPTLGWNTDTLLQNCNEDKQTLRHDNNQLFLRRKHQRAAKQSPGNLYLGSASCWQIRTYQVCCIR